MGWFGVDIITKHCPFAAQTINLFSDSSGGSKFESKMAFRMVSPKVSHHGLWISEAFSQGPSSESTP